MTIDALVPIGGNHAIQGAAFVLSWSVELTDSELEKVAGFHPHFSKALPVMQRVEMMSVTVDSTPRPAFGVNKAKARKNDGPRTTHQSMSLGAIHFIKVENGHGGQRQSRVVQVNKTNLAVIINDYEGWAEAMSFLVSIVERILSVVLNGRPLTGMMLQYTDSFTWKREPSALHWPSVFSLDSPLIPRSAFSQENLWHSHHGYMLDRSNVTPHVLTENVNVDVVMQNEFKVINIFTSHSGQLKSGAWTKDAALSILKPLFDDFHTRNKDLLRSLLTDQVLDLIGLKK